ncbi:2-oxoacid:acceptor oxidoreductase subunit alpha [archaeon]|nr:2-oxoacid:acceptor oxidoreductase subunit alpha [archaeon]
MKMRKGNNNSNNLMQGNEAISQAGLDAGMGFFAGYPITPASEIMHYLANKENKEFTFVHAEDEIASLQMCIGASLAGKKAMTATSGPGFSLMQEGIGLAFKLEIPLVIANVQRVGPSTGMPTLPSQGDILQTFHGTHGEYTAIAFCPNSVNECYRLTIEAFNASEQLKTPVILLTDGFVSHMYEQLSQKSNIKIIPHAIKPIGSGIGHLTGLVSKNGVPRTKDRQAYIEWNNKIQKKFAELKNKYAYYEYAKNKNADTLLIAYGITSRVVSPLKNKYSLFRPIRLFPVVEKIREIAKEYKRVVVVEMNCSQYRFILEQFLKRDLLGINILGGSLSLGEIEEKLKKI